MSGVRNLYQGKFSLSGVSVPSKKKFSHGLPEANVQRSAPLKQTPEKREAGTLDTCSSESSDKPESWRVESF